VSRHSEHLQIAVIDSVLVLVLARTFVCTEQAVDFFLPHHRTSNSGLWLLFQDCTPSLLATNGAVHLVLVVERGRKKIVLHLSRRQAQEGKKKKKSKKTSCHFFPSGPQQALSEQLQSSRAGRQLEKEQEYVLVRRPGMVATALTPLVQAVENPQEAPRSDQENFQASPNHPGVHELPGCLDACAGTA
jgi:hypothetical protein